MITLHPTAKQIDEIENLYDFKALKSSITKGKSNFVGAIGEIVLFDYLRERGNDVVFKNTFDYDMIVNGKSVDIKTKRCTTQPKSNYLCSIAATSKHQKCEYYIFVRVLTTLDELYVLGSISKKEFFEKAKFNRKGQEDVNGWKFAADCYNLPISELKDLK